MAQNETEIQVVENRESYRRAYNDLVVGYDCAVPTEIKSHELDTIEDCEEKMIKESSTPAQVQILQKSNKYVIQAISCSHRRTKKLSNCGSHDHSVSCYSEVYTYRKIEITEKQCKKWFEEKQLATPDKQIINLKVDHENVFSYYQQGYQYAHHDLLGSSIKCSGQNYIFDNKTTVSHIVIFHEDTLILEKATLLMQDNSILHKEKGRLLDCVPTSERCSYDNTIYVWSYQKPRCELYVTKQVMGEIITLKEKRIFMANDSLIHLELLAEQRRCERNVASTDFRDIFVLNLAEENKTKQTIQADDVSVFRDFSIRDKFVFNKLAQLLRISVQQLSQQHCVDTNFAKLNYNRLHSRMKSTNIQPFSIRRNTGNFVLPFGENIYSFKCSKRLFEPMSLRKCYNLLPVVETNRNLVAESTNLTTLQFLSQYDRILQPTAEEVPCSEYFNAKFRTLDTH